MSIHARKTAIALLSCSAFFMTALGDFSGPSHSGPSLVSSALAKSDNAGGKGSGNGNAGGNSNGNAGGNGNGKSSTAGSNGKSSASAASGSQSNGNSGNGLGGLIRGLFGKKNQASVTTTASIGTAKNNGQAKKQTIQEIRALASPPVPSARANALPKEKNLNAKLAGLNSLKRNFHAYLNSADPRMAAIRDYALASVEYENLLASEEYAALETALNDAQLAFGTAVQGLESYDALYADIATAEDLTGRRDELDTAILDLEGQLTGDATADADIQAQIDALTLERDAVQAVLDTEGSALQTAQSDLYTLVGDLDEQTSDDALIAALLAAANDNRVAEYGEDAYIDEDILAWAKELLGVDGETEVYGKIDEIRDYLAAQAEAEEVPLVEDATSDPANTL